MCLRNVVLINKLIGYLVIEWLRMSSSNIFSAVLHIGDVVHNAVLMDELAQCLDREYRVMKNWKHLARELNIPPVTQKEFEVYLSPTVCLFQFLATSNPRLTIGKLRVALQATHRNDLVQDLKGLYFSKYFHCYFLNFSYTGF